MVKDQAAGGGTHETRFLRTRSATWSTRTTIIDLHLRASGAKARGVTVHFGRVFGFAGEKGAEKSLGDGARKYKGRVVFQGNQVWDSNHDHAIFQDLSSNPATMDAAKAVAHAAGAATIIPRTPS